MEKCYDSDMYSQSYSDNSSMHEWPSMDVYIASHEPLRCTHISEWDEAEERERLS
jgi:hypothetical protein